MHFARIYPRSSYSEELRFWHSVPKTVFVTGKKKKKKSNTDYTVMDTVNYIYIFIETVFTLL